MHQKRKLEIVTVPYSKEVSKVSMAADAIVLGVDAAMDGLRLALSVPEQKTILDRLVWMVFPGQEIPSGANSGESVGVFRYTKTTEDGDGVGLVAVFVEPQNQAILRPSNLKR